MFGAVLGAGLGAGLGTGLKVFNEALGSFLTFAGSDATLSLVSAAAFAGFDEALKVGPDAPAGWPAFAASASSMNLCASKASWQAVESSRAEEYSTLVGQVPDFKALWSAV